MNARASLIFILLFSANGFAAELGGLASRAEVTGPRGSFVTEMISLADGTTRFVQIYPPNDPKGPKPRRAGRRRWQTGISTRRQRCIRARRSGRQFVRGRPRCGAPRTRQRVAAHPAVAARTRGDGRRHRDHRACRLPQAQRPGTPVFRNVRALGSAQGSFRLSIHRAAAIPDRAGLALARRAGPTLPCCSSGSAIFATSPRHTSA